MIESYTNQNSPQIKKVYMKSLNLSMDLHVEHSNNQKKVFSSISQKNSGTNTPKNVIKKSRYLTPIPFIRSSNNHKIYGSKYYTEQHNLSSILIKEELKEKLKIPFDKLTSNDNKILKGLDSTRRSSNNNNNNIEYNTFDKTNYLYFFLIRIEQKSSRISRQEFSQNDSVISNSTHEGT